MSLLTIEHAVDRQLLLRYRQYAHLRDGHYDANRIHAEEGILGRCGQQLCPKHSLVCWRRGRSTAARCHRQRLVVHRGGRHRRGKQHSHMGHAKIRASMADGHECPHELMSEALMAYRKLLKVFIRLGSVHTQWRIRRSRGFHWNCLWCWT